ncbi:MAG: BamA/TamA family outer membrane protein [Longimicrobiales bacterium]
MKSALLVFSLFVSPVAAQQMQRSDAYHDPRARELVRLARERRQFVDRSITRYQATAKERISMGLRTRLRDRLFYRRETASRIDWQRGGPINITVLGAREALPAVTPKIQVPDDLKDFLPRLAFDPMDPEGLIRVATTVMKHPLADGAEEHYRYRTGGTTTINLGERSVRLVELRIEPRRRDFHLMSGSFWIDDDTHSVVQIVFRMAKDFNFVEDVEDEEDKRDFRKVPGLFKPIRAELQYVTIEYGLMHLRWWLPRLIAGEGVFQMGAIRTPLHYERLYSYDGVVGDTTAALITRSSADSSGFFEKPCRPRSEMQVTAEIGDGERSQEQRERQQQRQEERGRGYARADSIRMANDTAYARRRREAIECSKLYKVTVADSAQLLTSAELPASIYGDLEALTSAAELGRLADQLQRLAKAPWQLQRPSFSWGLGGGGLVRYNKVEGLSVGARTEFDFGRVRADVTGRFGVADLEPKAELGITRSTHRSQIRLGAYHRLNVMDEAAGFGTITASFNALLFGKDDRDYYRESGLELSHKPAETNPQWYELKLFAEQQRSASVETNVSLKHAFDEAHTFLPNRPAQRADQAGAQLTLRAFGGQNPRGFRWSGELTALASAGTFDFTRESALLQIGFPLPFRMVGALEAAAGTSTGPIPTQNLWYLGGVRSVRGYDIGDLTGTAFWRGRAEIGTAFPGARLVGFTDLGWAGDRNNIADRASMLSVGAGASLMDGILRIDLARALRGDRGWKLHLSVDGIL